MGSWHVGIYRSSVTTSVRQIIVTTGLAWPTALAVDFAGTVTQLNLYVQAGPVNSSLKRFSLLVLFYYYLFRMFASWS